MGEVLTSRLCQRCRVLYRKNSDIMGDYDEEGRLQSYCPLCGVMHPPLTVVIMSFQISRRNRHNLGTKIATTHGLPYNKMHKLTSTLKFTDDDEFVQEFTKHISATFNIDIKKQDVMKCLQGSGKIYEK